MAHGPQNRLPRPGPTNDLATRLREEGYLVPVGLDEVGRGAWAGPLVMGAVILPTGCVIDGLRDSKQLVPAKREQIARVIHAVASAVGLGIVPADELDAIGLAAALRLAGTRALAALAIKPDVVLFDGLYPLRGITLRQETITRGDQLVASIAAASVVAKAARDQMMRELHKATDLSSYRFDLHKGYPSPYHRAELARRGPSRVHRYSFKPIRELTANYSPNV